MDHHGPSSIMVGPTCRLVYQSYRFTDMSLLELHDVGLLNYSTHLDSRHQYLLTLLETILTKVQHSRVGQPRLITKGYTPNELGVFHFSTFTTWLGLVSYGLGWYLTACQLA